MRRVLSWTAIPLIFVALISLGFWQLERAKEKQALLDEFAARVGQPPIAVSGERLGAGQSGAAATIRGRFDGQGQFLWDNRTYEGRPGFHVLTPFVILGSDTRILVDRGWIALEGGREDLPRPSVPSGEREVAGRLYEPLMGFTLEAQAPEFAAPLRQNLDLVAYAKDAPFSIQPYVLRLAVDAPDGFVRAWPEPRETSVQRHRAYALQWFAMAGVFIIVVVAVVRRQRREHQSKALS